MLEYADAMGAFLRTYSRLVVFLGFIFSASLFADWLQIQNGGKFQCGSWGCAQLYVDAAGRFYFTHGGRRYYAEESVATSVLSQPDYAGNSIAQHRLRARQYYAGRVSRPAVSVSQNPPPPQALGSHQSGGRLAHRGVEETQVTLPDGITLDTPLESLLARKDLDYFIHTRSARNFDCVRGSVGTNFLFQNGKFIEVNALVTGRFPNGPSCDLAMNELISGTDGVLHKFDCRVSRGVSLKVELTKAYDENGISFNNLERPDRPSDDQAIADVLSGRRPKEVITLKRIHCRNLKGTPLTVGDYVRSMGSFIRLEIKPKQ